MKRVLQFAGLAMCALPLFACGKSAATPTAPAATSTQVSAPATLAAPVDRATVSYFAQPLTFTFTDPAVPSGRTLADEAFELAAAPEFRTLLYTLQLPLTGGPTRTVTLAIPRLAAGQYYWRVRSRLTDAPSEVSEIRQFHVDEPSVTLPVPKEIFQGLPPAIYGARRWPMLLVGIPIGRAEESITQLQVQWATDSSFSTLIEDSLIAASDRNNNYPLYADIPETLLPASLTYWHRSRAVQPSRGTAGPWTASWSATTPTVSSQWTMWMRTCEGGFGLWGDLKENGAALEFRAPGLRIRWVDGVRIDEWIDTGLDLGPDHFVRGVNDPVFTSAPGVGGVHAFLPRSAETNALVPLTWERTADGFGGVAAAQSGFVVGLSDLAGGRSCRYTAGRDFRWRLVAPGK